MKKLRLGKIHADFVTLDQALDVIQDLVTTGRGGYVVTPNVDHVVLAEKDEALQAAYAEASLSLVDGMPLKWASSLLGLPLPEKISGSDLVRPALRRAAQQSMRVYFLGSAPGVGEQAARILEAEIPGLSIVGTDSPPLGFEEDPTFERQILDKMMATRPQLVLVALGCPKQEHLMHRWHRQGLPPVFLGIGASLDFIAGRVKRSPSWMSNLGLEWVYRLSQDPKRLAHRYLVRDAAILPILVRLLRTPKDKLVFYS